MKLSDLHEGKDRVHNTVEYAILKQLDSLAAKYDLRLRAFMGQKQFWTKNGGWYHFYVSTAHGWAKEESGDADILPIEIRWKGFINALIVYAHELAKSGRVVKFENPDIGNTEPPEPTVTDLEDAKGTFTMMGPSSGINRPVPAFMMYIGDANET